MEEQKKNRNVHPAIALLVILGATVLAAYLTIPTHNHGPIHSNEMSAVGGLKMLMSQEALWRVASMSGTGKTDYWTYDVSCLARLPLKTRPDWGDSYFLTVTQADAAPAKDDVFGQGVLMPSSGITPQYGYLFRAMLKDEKGELYNQNKFKGTEIACSNDWKLGFVAYPAVQGKTGTRTFIINQDGVIYGRINKSDADKIILEWPAEELKKAKENPAEEGLWHIVD